MTGPVWALPSFHPEKDGRLDGVSSVCRKIPFLCDRGQLLLAHLETLRRLEPTRAGSERKLLSSEITWMALIQIDGPGSWGAFLDSTDPSALGGTGDRVIGSFIQVTRDANGSRACEKIRRSRCPSRVRIYELFPRLFGNVNTGGKQNGRLAENGCGKFADVNEAALSSIVEMNFTQVWLLGVLRHATTTGYRNLGFALDDSDLMKGLAGSPFAIKDYFDLFPDLATQPENHVAEFRSLVDRIHTKD